MLGSGSGARLASTPEGDAELHSLERTRDGVFAEFGALRVNIVAALAKQQGS
jgi:hypothetical protein